MTPNELPGELKQMLKRNWPCKSKVGEVLCPNCTMDVNDTLVAINEYIRKEVVAEHKLVMGMQTVVDKNLEIWSDKRLYELEGKK